MNFIAIYPNNDPGSHAIVEYMKHTEGNWMYSLPSMRFEYFLTLLKNADVIVGNSSAGVREAPVYGIPTVNVGTRQSGRVDLPSIINVPDKREKITSALINPPKRISTKVFGNGDSAKQFIEILSTESFWNTPRQKQFWEGEQCQQV